MAIKPVLRMGEPLLFAKAVPVARFDTPELHALIQDMHDTMAQMNGAGIAAPQIGEYHRPLLREFRSGLSAQRPCVDLLSAVYEFL